MWFALQPLFQVAPPDFDCPLDTEFRKLCRLEERQEGPTKECDGVPGIGRDDLKETWEGVVPWNTSKNSHSSLSLSNELSLQKCLQL